MKKLVKGGDTSPAKERLATARKTVDFEHCVLSDVNNAKDE
jgi:hypothetical protein